MLSGSCIATTRKQQASSMNLRLTVNTLNLRNGANEMLFYPGPLGYF